MYSTVLFDLDHTLFDTDQAEHDAFESTMQSIGLADADAVFPLYDEINQGLWRAVERHELTPVDVKVLRFSRFANALGRSDVDPQAMAEHFAAGLGRFGGPYPGAVEMLEQLSGRVALGLVTNGLSEVQRARLSGHGLARYFTSTVISAEVGVSKPSPAIFDIAFEQLGEPDRGSVVMVGDSLTSDIQGANNAGIASCWYDRHAGHAGHAGLGGPVTSGPRIDHRVRQYGELLALLRIT